MFVFLFKSGYLILKPSVFISVPDGKLIPDNLESIKDLPLFEFPITPILTIFLSSMLLSNSSLYLIFQPLIISVNIITS